MSVYALIVLTALGAQPELAPEQVAYLETLAPEQIRWRFQSYEPKIPDGVDALDVTIGHAVLDQTGSVIGLGQEKPETIHVDVVEHNGKRWFLTEGEKKSLSLHNPVMFLGSRMTELRRIYVICYSVLGIIVTLGSIALFRFGTWAGVQKIRNAAPSVSPRIEMLWMLAMGGVITLIMGGTMGTLWYFAPHHPGAILLGSMLIVLMSLYTGNAYGIWSYARRNTSQKPPFGHIQQIGQSGFYI